MAGRKNHKKTRHERKITEKKMYKNLTKNQWSGRK